MITQLQQQLKDLNQAYYEGDLSFGDYRYKRGLMLEALFEDTTVQEDFTPKTVPMQKVMEVTQELPKTPPPVAQAPAEPVAVQSPVSPQPTSPAQANNDPLAAVISQATPKAGPEAARAPAEPAPTPAPQPTPKSAAEKKPAEPAPAPIATASPFEESSGKGIYIIVAVVILCAAIGAAVMMSGGSDEETASPMSTTTAKPASALEAVIQKQLSNNTWTQQQLKEIESIWNKASKEERSKARQQATFNKLDDTLKAVASEQKALIDLGDQNAVSLERQINRLLEILKQD